MPTAASPLLQGGGPVGELVSRQTVQLGSGASEPVYTADMRAQVGQLVGARCLLRAQAWTAVSP